MIFAHLSAELVCAYEGTLAAGAIVTVLDPQYPPTKTTKYGVPGRELEPALTSVPYQSIFKFPSLRR